jgi:hypothetical protein
MKLRNKLFHNDKKTITAKIAKKKKKYCTQMTSKNTDLSTNKWHGQLYTHTM